MPIRVVLADDHELVRSGIRALLDEMAGVQVVGEASDGQELMSVLARAPAEVLLLDVAMPRMDGISALAAVRVAHPALRVMLLSMQQSGEVAKRALAMGAAGYLLKDAAPAELELALERVAGGGLYLSGGIARCLAAPGTLIPEDQLTPRQIEVLTCIASGMSAREIGSRLGLSARTVDAHRSHIMDRLGVSDIAALTRYAMRHRLVPH